MRKIARYILFYPLLIIVGCHTLMTGSPIPLWHIEELQSPQSVASIEDTCLVLTNGESVSLPYIQELSKEHGIFREAVRHGVEVRPDGEVMGLLPVQRFCGNDPVVYRVLRINLTDLSGALKPHGLDPDIIPAEERQTFAKIIGDIPDDHRIDSLFLARLRQIRRQIAFQTGNESLTRVQGTVESVNMTFDPAGY